MSRLVTVTGGARSGKSRFAQSLLEGREEVLYIATSIPFDDEMKDRIKKHREDRSESWKTLECYKDIYIALRGAKEKYMLLDCLTIMVTNLMFHYESDWDNIPLDRVDQIEGLIVDQVKELIKYVREWDINFIVVTNELGMGLVPANRLSRIFRDIAGRVNQLIAGESDEVYIVISGIPLRIK